MNNIEIHKEKISNAVDEVFKYKSRTVADWYIIEGCIDLCLLGTKELNRGDAEEVRHEIRQRMRHG